VHLIERLAPTDDGNTIRYEVTVEDPTTWTRALDSGDNLEAVIGANV
jgi:hypothetical protein